VELLPRRQKVIHETAVDVLWRDFRVFLPRIIGLIAKAVVKRLRRTLDMADYAVEIDIRTGGIRCVTALLYSVRLGLYRIRGPRIAAEYWTEHQDE
jgi:hypothetical protein